MENQERRNYLAKASFILSIIALFASVKSCNIADRAYDLSLEQRTDNVWVGVHQSEQDIVVLNPSNSKVILLEGEVNFHSDFIKSKLKVDGSTKMIRLKGIHPIAKIFVENKHKDTILAGFISIETEVFPFVLSTKYTIDGKLHERYGIYNLRYDMLPDTNGSGGIRLEFLGMVFVQEAGLKKDAIKMLDDLWKKGV